MLLNIELLVHTISKKEIIDTPPPPYASLGLYWLDIEQSY